MLTDPAVGPDTGASTVAAMAALEGHQDRGRAGTRSPYREHAREVPQDGAQQMQMRILQNMMDQQQQTMVLLTQMIASQNVAPLAFNGPPGLTPFAGVVPAEVLPAASSPSSLLGVGSETKVLTKLPSDMVEELERCTQMLHKNLVKRLRCKDAIDSKCEMLPILVEGKYPHQVRANQQWSCCSLIAARLCAQEWTITSSSPSPRI
jgi:hypothetical protein